MDPLASILKPHCIYTNMCPISSCWLPGDTRLARHVNSGRRSGNPKEAPVVAASWLVPVESWAVQYFPVGSRVTPSCPHVDSGRRSGNPKEAPVFPGRRSWLAPVESLALFQISLHVYKHVRRRGRFAGHDFRASNKLTLHRSESCQAMTPGWH